MSKIIKLTPECIDEIRKDFEETINTAKLSDGKINFTKSFGNIKREATLYFTELAWLKMQTLVREFDKEVAWHGIAKRGEDVSKDEYIISDILVYPQEVTGATVNTDQEKYQMWLMGHDDEIFDNIRLQGHSHVNMGVTPSGVDISLYEQILDQLDDDMFYIFIIWNKRGDKTIKIYDLAKNVLFETPDCAVKVMDDGTGIEKFLKNAKNMVKDKIYTPPASTQYWQRISEYSGYSGYGGYGNYGNGVYHMPPAATKSSRQASDHDQKKTPTSAGKNGKRKGKRKQGGMANASDDPSQFSMSPPYSANADDWDDPYSAFGWCGE